jgi:hypothetical protein
MVLSDVDIQRYITQGKIKVIHHPMASRLAGEFKG